MRGGIILVFVIALFAGSASPALAKRSIDDVRTEALDEVASTVDSLREKLAKTQRSDEAIVKQVDKAIADIRATVDDATADIEKLVSLDESQSVLGATAIAAIEAAGASATIEVSASAPSVAPAPPAPATTSAPSTTTTAPSALEAPARVEPAVVVPAQPRIDDSQLVQLPLTRLPDRMEVGSEMASARSAQPELAAVALPARIGGALSGPVALGTILWEAIRSTPIVVVLGAMLGSIITAFVLWKRAPGAEGTE